MEVAQSNDKTSDTISKYFKPSLCCRCGSNDLSQSYPIDKNYAGKMSGISLTDVNVGVAKCRSCRHQFINPVPQPEFLQCFYDAYMSKAKSGFYKDRISEKIPDSFRVRYGVWLGHIKALSESGKDLLDVGSGLGMFLRLARDEGFKVQGVEPNQEAVNHLSSVYGIDVRQGLFESLSLNKKYDVITMWDLLEHLADPRSTLDKSRKLLTDNGLLVLEIPTRDSVLHRLAKILYRISFGRVVRPLYLVCGIHHLHYFSEKGISKLLQQCGFSVVEIHRGGTDIQSLYKKGDGSIYKGLLNSIYNLSMAAVFAFAKVIGRQNKLIIFSRKKATDH